MSLFRNLPSAFSFCTCSYRWRARTTRALFSAWAAVGCPAGRLVWDLEAYYYLDGECPDMSALGTAADVATPGDPSDVLAASPDHAGSRAPQDVRICMAAA